ncbi:MAG: RHS repeat-associated core domain-containing protein [Bacteroidia bacterium]
MHKKAGDNSNKPPKYDLKGKDLKEYIIESFMQLGLDEALFVAGKSGKIPYGQIKKYFRENPDSLDTTGLNQQPVENLQFYYHPDHLGSASYITDVSGEVHQHMEYFAFGETFVEERNAAEYTRYLFNGKELDEETGFYYYGARYYNPQTSVWLSVDPLADKYPNITGYAYTLNNPINLIDPDGMQVEGGGNPDDLTMAKLSQDVYDTKNGKYTSGGSRSIDGWSLSKKDFGIQLTDDKSGFNSAVYEKKVGDETKYVYVTQGSDFDNGGNDWSENYKQSMGQFSQQYKTSTDNARALKDILGDNLSFTGHSLGGGLASANALATGLDAVTFNAAGLHPNSKSSQMYGGLNQKANIRAYVVNGEIVHKSQSLIGLRAEGTIIKLPASYLPIIPFAGPKVNAGIIGVNLGISAYNHTIGAVVDRMKEMYK